MRDEGLAQRVGARIGDHAGDAGNQDHVWLHRGTDDAGDETEVGRQPVIKAVNDVAEKAARADLVPRLGALAGEVCQRSRVRRGLLGEL